MRNIKRRDHLGDLVVDGRMILRRIIRKQMWTGFMWLRIESNGGFS
jgi:hypothetical protein